MLRTTAIAKELATIERKMQETENATLREALKKKQARLKAELKDPGQSATKLAKTLLAQREVVKQLSKVEFNDLIRRLSKKPEYSFLKTMSKSTVKNDLEVTAKPVGWRFKGRGNYDKPTKAEIIKGKKNGTVYREVRPRRSDVSQVVRLKEGGGVDSIEPTGYKQNDAVEYGKKLIDAGVKYSVVRNKIEEHYAGLRGEIQDVMNKVLDYKESKMSYGGSMYAEGGGVELFQAGQKAFYLDREYRITIPIMIKSVDKDHNMLEAIALSDSRNGVYYKGARFFISKNEIKDVSLPNQMELGGSMYAGGGGVGMNKNSIAHSILSIAEDYEYEPQIFTHSDDSLTAIFRNLKLDLDDPMIIEMQDKLSSLAYSYNFYEEPDGALYLEVEKSESNFGKPGTGFDNPEYADKFKTSYDERGLMLKPTTDLKTLGSKLVVLKGADNKFTWKLILQNGSEYAKKGGFSSYDEAVKDYSENNNYAKGGSLEQESVEMINNQATSAKHHIDELKQVLSHQKHIEPWVIAKMQRATTDLSDITHYLDGKDPKMMHGGEIKAGDTIRLKTDLPYMASLENLKGKDLEVVDVKEVYFASGPKKFYHVMFDGDKHEINEDFVDHGNKMMTGGGVKSEPTNEDVYWDGEVIPSTIEEIDIDEPTEHTQADYIYNGKVYTIRYDEDENYIWNAKSKAKPKYNTGSMMAEGGSIEKYGIKNKTKYWIYDGNNLEMAGTVSILPNNYIQIKDPKGFVYPLSLLEQKYKNLKFEIYEKFARGGQLTTAQQKKFDQVMHEWGQGKLHSGSEDGPIVKDQDQAIAIAYAEARGMKKMAKGGGEVGFSSVAVEKANLEQLFDMAKELGLTNFQNLNKEVLRRKILEHFKLNRFRGKMAEGGGVDSLKKGDSVIWYIRERGKGTVKCKGIYLKDAPDVENSKGWIYVENKDGKTQIHKSWIIEINKMAKGGMADCGWKHKSK